MFAAWMLWYSIVRQLRSGFSRQITFHWFMVSLAAMMVRRDRNGVTSFIRSVGLSERCYQPILDNFQSSGFHLNQLTKIWAKTCFDALQSEAMTVNGRKVFLVDGVKIPKEGKRMPAVKSLHQESQSNSKPEYIMGHSCQAICLVAETSSKSLATPLISRIHEGYVTSNRDQRTLHDHLLSMYDEFGYSSPAYFVGDAYYANGKIIDGLDSRQHHLITRMRKSTVAYFDPKISDKKQRGRPQKYGSSCKLFKLFDDKDDSWISAKSPVYSEQGTTISYRVLDLLWKPAKGKKIRFVLIDHPDRGRCILASTDILLSPIEIIKLYGVRFKIEVAFKESVHTLGTYSYRFWMKDMDKKRRGDGDDYLHRKDTDYRSRYLNKVEAYHKHIQTGLIAQGIMQLIAIKLPGEIWSDFNSWMRTMKFSATPSESVVAESMRNTFPSYLLSLSAHDSLRLFLKDKMDPRRSLVKLGKAA